MAPPTPSVLPAELHQECLAWLLLAAVVQPPKTVLSVQASQTAQRAKRGGGQEPRGGLAGCPEAEGAGGGAGAGAASHCPSALDFFGADFISWEAMGRLLAGLLPELSLFVSCSHLTWVAGP